MTRVAVAEQRGAPAHVFVVFGATGDLARRELLPAIWRLQRGGKLGTQHVLGVSRDPEHDDRSYRAWVREALEAAGARDLAAWCDGCVHYQRLDAREPDGGEMLLLPQPVLGLSRGQIVHALLDRSIIDLARCQQPKQRPCGLGGRRVLALAARPIGPIGGAIFAPTAVLALL